MSTQTVQSRGIYHGLPVYPSSTKGLTAIITGANGISGYHMLKVLSKDPQRWTKIYCLSRRPPAIPGGLPSNAEFISCDFLQSPDKIADVLKEKNVKADYVFFYSYVQVKPKPGAGLWSDAKEMTRVNRELLVNFCEGLKIANIKPKRIMLQTGAKNYGLHVGPIKAPSEEWDPRTGENVEPNFYYAQEDYLWDYCKNEGVEWNIAMPAAILGAVPDAAMNMALPLAIYCTVQKHLGKKLDFPGDRLAWQYPVDQSSAMLNGYLEEWAVLSPHTANQKFNAVDNSVFTCESFWPRLAGWYGLEYSPPSGCEPGGNGLGEGYSEVEWGSSPPPRGYGPRGKTRFRFTLTEWAKTKEVQKAWGEIAEKEGLSLKELGDDETVDRIFGFGDRMLMRAEPALMSMTKARKLGWHGFVDSSECLLEVFQDFAKLKMIPAVPMVDVKFL